MAEEGMWFVLLECVIYRGRPPLRGHTCVGVASGSQNEQPYLQILTLLTSCWTILAPNPLSATVAASLAGEVRREGWCGTTSLPLGDQRPETFFPGPECPDTGGEESGGQGGAEYAEDAGRVTARLVH